MIHYTCDCCKQPIDVENDMRFVVRVEVYPSLEATEDAADERDHLQEIQDILERIDDDDQADISDEVYHQARFDLCRDCRNLYVKNPLSRSALQALGFSQN